MLFTDQTPTWKDIEDLYGHDMWDTDNPFPIWDEGKRDWLQNAIADHFRFRRFAQETGSLAVYYLNRKMREMMPTINPIFKALDEEHDILSTYDTRDEMTGTSTSASDGRQLYSATPQIQLSDMEDYATNLTDTKSSGSDSNKSTSTHSGRNATVGEQLSRWLASVNNALYIVFNGLEPLFAQFWDEEGF